MSKKEKQDPIEQLKEWEDHMYNKGYWMHRYSPFYPPKNQLERHKQTIIYILVLLPITALFVGFYIAERSTNLIAPIVLLLLFLSLAIITLWRQSRQSRKKNNIGGALIRIEVAKDNR